MKIQTKLFIAAGISVLATLIVAAVIFIGYSREAQMEKQNILIQQIHEGAQALQLLATEYLLFDRKHVMVQWNEQQKALSRKIDIIQLANAEWKLLKRKMSRYNNRTDRLFRKLVDYRSLQAKQPGQESPYEKRIVTRLMVNTLELSLTAGRLNGQILKNLTTARNNYNITILVVLAFAAAVIGVTLLWAIRGFTIPLRKLQDGITGMGTGSTEERVGLSGNNEITEVANEFDKMAKRLRYTTVSRNELLAEIAAREKAQRERTEFEDLLKHAQKMAGIGYWGYDPVTHIPTWTEEVYHIFGLDPSQGEASYEEHRELIHPDDWRTFDEAVLKLLNEGESYDLFLRSVHKDGNIVHYNTKGFAAHGHDGRIEKLYGVCQDVTDRKRAEEALREQKKKAEQLLQLAGVMFVGLDSNGTVTLVNRKACEILNGVESEIIGLNWFDHFIPEDIRENVRQVFQQLMAEDISPVEYYENDVTAKTGEKKIIAWHNSVIRDQAGKITGILSSGEDITSRTELEKQLRQSQKLEAIGTLAGGIAHDFNNILGIIIGNAELALDDTPDWNPAHPNLQEIKTASLRAKDVVKQLLSFSRKTEFNRKPIEIGPIVEESMKLLRASIPSSIQIHSSVQKDAGTVKADPTQIHQVLINLCTNAAHAMEEKGGILEISLGKIELTEADILGNYEIEPGSYVRLTVSDTGKGIEQEVLQRIFDPYFTTKEVGKGTGMGLSIVHGIVKSHNGSITVKSETGKGAVFDLIFPRAGLKQAEAPKVPGKLPTGEERILFVDDESAMVNLNQQRLERLGYEIIPKTDPLEALDFFRANPDLIDLVITDMTMPHMTGDRLAQEILKIRSDTPIILCTGYSNRISEEKAQELGIRKYIEKPIEMVTLARSVREVLDGRSIT